MTKISLLKIAVVSVIFGVYRLIDFLKNIVKNVTPSLPSLFDNLIGLWGFVTVAYVAYWVLDITQYDPAAGIKISAWYSFNINNPVLMYAGIGSVIFFIFIFPLFNFRDWGKK
ncbi:MAG: hypothetical protein WC603_03055 [Candidatus Paceibacterota bacterium]|jgi:hypothetical protein